MPDLWTPQAELPHEAFVERLHRAIAKFAQVTGVEKPLVEVELESAFRHQVRAHMAAIGHPLVGDRLYRGPALPAELGLTLDRHFLHANELAFHHPVTGAEVHVKSPLPEDLAAVVNKLKSR